MRGSIVWYDGVAPKHMVPIKEEERSANSRFDYTDVLATAWQAVGFNLKRVDDGKGNHHYEYVQGDKGGSMKGKPPPKPTTPEKAKEVAGGPYEASDNDIESYITRKAYEKNLADTLREYKLVFSNRDEMLKKRGSIGFEYADVIELADHLKPGLGHEYLGNEVLSHERAAKIILGTENRVDGDHEAAHDEIKELTNILKRQYINEALHLMRN